MSKFKFLLVVIVLLFPIAAYPSVAPDSLKGDWDVTFVIAGHTVGGTMSFDVNGSVVTGKVYSVHTGAGSVSEGKFDDGKMKCKLVFEKHESIALYGELKDGKLSGTFETEGTTGTWTASRKK